MNNQLFRGAKVGKIASMLFATYLLSVPQSFAFNIEDSDPASQTVERVERLNPTTVDVVLSENQRITMDFYGENIVRIFQDNNGGILRDPESKPEAQILVDNPRRDLSKLEIDENASQATITTQKMKIVIDKKTTLFEITNLETNEVVVKELKPVKFTSGSVELTLAEGENEYFYGGGVQNGRFSHKGKVISIENENSWTDGGVASPNPFYWSTEGYAVMPYTFKKGSYDFGSDGSGEVKIMHEDDYLDIFFMVNDGAVALLNDFYQLTGNPVFVPKFGFYEGHLNAYNRDYWTEVEEGGVLFEDGKRYKESAKKDSLGFKETLNGESGKYQFSARAVVDRYESHDMPLGWLLPNDGYGAGYGQTGTLDGNIQNLKSLAEYSQNKGVEIGLWTQSDLHPKEGVEALLQRDIVKEVRDAGVRVLKTDVAWVGAGYSFGLNGVSDVAQIMSYYGNNARPFIISLDGWAGTQRYAGVWSGDQSGGDWEYIRFHIPTYIGSGLSGQPNISSDMDGIFGGKKFDINTRDFQWKTFTPQQLNMDGWGSNEKYPHALGEPATSINRMYLKLRSELMPYIYTIAEESVDGMPMVRAMFLEYPNKYTLGTATKYQFLFGSDFLIAPIYQNTAADTLGNDIRNGIYLPEGEEWVDYFTGEVYEGGVIINNFGSPIWKLPIFVKNGAIIPMTNPNNNVAQINKNYRKYELYPSGKSSFTEYDDDGVSELYRASISATTTISSSVVKDLVTISILPTQGSFDGFISTKTTELVVNTTSEPTKVTATLNNKNLKLKKASSLEEYNSSENVYFWDKAPNLNKFATPGSEFEKVVITKNPQLLVKLAECDVQQTTIEVNLKGFEFSVPSSLLSSTSDIVAPQNAVVTAENTEAYTMQPTWSDVDGADYYEIAFNDQIYSTIKNSYLLFEDLQPETNYDFKLRSVNKAMQSDWTEFSATTKSDPLEFALRGLMATCSVRAQGGQHEANLFDFDLSSGWHTDWGTKAVPFEMVIDLNSISTIEKLQYIPRIGGGNGVILQGTFSYSYDNKSWSEEVPFVWERNGEMKEVEFSEKPKVRYIKMSVTEAVGNFGSGTEIYVFKVPGTSSFIPGDINSDGKLDENDITSYGNYTGLRLGDSDFEGYVSVGDGNYNNLIDAYDISQVGVKLDGGVGRRGRVNLAGSFTVSADKESYAAGEEITLTVVADSLQDVNALSFAMAYDPAKYEYVSTKAIAMKSAVNFTNDRLHTNGVKSLYPTFVNLGDQEPISGSGELFVITFKAKSAVKFDLEMTDAMIVDKRMNTIEF